MNYERQIICRCTPALIYPSEWRLNEKKNWIKNSSVSAIYKESLLGSKQDQDLFKINQGFTPRTIWKSMIFFCIDVSPFPGLSKNIWYRFINQASAHIINFFIRLAFILPNSSASNIHQANDIDNIHFNLILESCKCELWDYHTGWFSRKVFWSAKSKWNHR